MTQLIVIFIKWHTHIPWLKVQQFPVTMENRLPKFLCKSRTVVSKNKTSHKQLLMIFGVVPVDIRYSFWSKLSSIDPSLVV